MIVHSLVIVVLPPTTEDIVGDLEQAMMPFHYEHRREITWDWYQIGGRWTGVFSKEYNPTTDPANLEECRFCQGEDCIHCNGTGLEVKWPTQWKDFAGDVATPAQVLKMKEDHKLGYYFLMGETFYARTWYHDDKQYPDCFENNPEFDSQVENALRLAHPNSKVVAVDIHE